MSAESGRDTRIRSSSPTLGSGIRQTWMDWVRGICVVLVVFRHVTSLLVEREAALPAGILAFDEASGPFRQPLLMALSGLVFPFSLRKSTRAFFASRLRSVAWPYLVWSVLTLAALGSLSLATVSRIPLFAPTYLWYLWFLLAYSALAFCLARLLRRLGLGPTPLLLVAGVLLAASAGLPETHRLSRFAFLGAFFLFGWWWAERQPLQERTVGARLAVTVGGVAAAVVAVAAILGADARHTLPWAWGPIGLVVALAAAGPRFRAWRPRSARALQRGLQFLGRQALVMYVTHMSVIALTLDVALQWLPVGPSFSLALVAGLGVGAVVAGLTRVPIVRAFFVWPLYGSTHR
ncbi:acyltransferase family protein [Frondihabitans cladoniiphilus]|uniref:Acyltransferase n=1 Tax=Frondihabitans cladoniiphilus TaxID=715785 RepID=A0ABP8VKF2_9MICO